MDKQLSPRPLPGGASLGVAIVRVLTGVALVLHSFPKLENPSSWLPGDTFPGWALAIAAYAELIGGTLLALGLVAPFAAVLVVGVMAGAVYYHVQQGDSFIGSAGSGSYELSAIYGAVGLLVLFGGPGDLSMDRALFRRPSRK